MKGEPDTKHMVRHTMYFSDGTETTIECHKNPNAEEIEQSVRDSQAEIASEEVVETEVPKKKRATKKK